MESNTTSVYPTDTGLTSDAGEPGHSAAQKIDENREAAAGKLYQAASALHQKADTLPGGEKVASMAHATADKLHATAEYVKAKNVNAMMTDMERVVKNNPGPALLSAAVIGFLVGRAFSSND
jgi:ElaB/YqjD/DUF883 family membrane-anchored ribosome-binding protein